MYWTICLEDLGTNLTRLLGSRSDFVRMNLKTKIRRKEACTPLSERDRLFIPIVIKRVRVHWILLGS